MEPSQYPKLDKDTLTISFCGFGDIVIQNQIQELDGA
jgi:hypothetical protein